MAAARYLVVREPGAPVTDVGFVKAGEAFSAPTLSYIPSKTFKPLNKEALDALTKLGVKTEILVPEVVEPPVEKVLGHEGLEKLAKAEKQKSRAADRE